MLVLRTVLLLISTPLFVAGCGGDGGGGEGNGSDGGGNGGSSSGEVKVVSTDGLPELDEYMQAMDAGRIEAAPPKDWRFLPRSSKYLVQWTTAARGEAPVPRIAIAVSDATFEKATVSEENVKEFANWIAAELKKNEAGLIEDVKPMVIGGRPCARYVDTVLLQIGNRERKRLERQVLVSTVMNRRYTVYLSVEQQGLTEKPRDAAYAVLAGLKFPKLSTPAPVSDKDSKGGGDSPEKDADDSDA